MKKRKQWKKILHDRRCQKLGRKKTKRHSRHSNTVLRKTLSKNRNGQYHGPDEKRYIAPERFSLIDNANDTIEYFNNIYDGIKKKKLKTKFHIDSSKVNHVTVDALIYLIAIMDNMKLNRILKYEFYGNLPQGYAARMVYLDSGFMNYVQSALKRLPNNTFKVRIVSDDKARPTLSKKICLFAMEKFEVLQKDVLFIQKILVELMSNSFYHAYPEDVKEEMISKWYLYAECINGTMRIIFADTGKGITGTIRKRFLEKVSRINDCDLLETAFQPGNFIRTETRIPHRGNGLPGIKKVVENSPITSFWAFSGRGAIRIGGQKGNKILTKYRFEHKIHGTIYIFEFGKESMICEY